jgi:hypothetical protein
MPCYSATSFLHVTVYYSQLWQNLQIVDTDSALSLPSSFFEGGEAMLGIEPRVSHMLGKCSTTVLHPRLLS